MRDRVCVMWAIEVFHVTNLLFGFFQLPVNRFKAMFKKVPFYFQAGTLWFQLRNLQQQRTKGSMEEKKRRLEGHRNILWDLKSLRNSFYKHISNTWKFISYHLFSMPKKFLQRKLKPCFFFRLFQTACLTPMKFHSSGVILSFGIVLFVSSIDKNAIGFTAREACKKSSYFIITVSNSTLDVSKDEWRITAKPKTTR